VVFLSDRDDVEDVNEALTYGVRGYISTSIEAEVAFAALRLIDAGGTYPGLCTRKVHPRSLD
jgi:DNA-binding NarL/FixJ family response regulator